VNEQRARPAPEATNRAHDVVSHLQAAALEMIAAARAFLDVAEELVKEPGEVTAMAATLANLAGRVAPYGAGGDGPGPESAGGHKPGPAGPGGHKQGPGVEHIRVS
jgi:hypothetical protein